MFKFITNNWQAKIICLIIASFLWGYVIIGESRVDNLPGKIPLQIRNVPAELVAIVDEDSVQVKISADRTTWNRLSATSIDAFIDLSGLSKGTHEVQVQTKSNIAGIEVVDVVPNKILVRLEAIAKKRVPVKTQIEGTAGEGLVAGEASIIPDNVEIIGAQSILDKIFEATAIIELKGETNQIEKNVPLIALDSKGEEIKNIEFSPKEVKVTLLIVKAGTSKTVGIKVKLTGMTKNGYWVNQIITAPTDVTISGNSGVIKGINYLETKSIDIDGLDKSITKSVGFELPSGVSIQDNIEQVKVEIKVAVTNVDKEMNAGYIYDNLAANLKVDSVDPLSIKVIVNGPADILNSLSSGNVQIHLDLSSFHSAGNISMDIDKNMITVPNGASASSYVPSAIRINLSNK